uniref:Uncharacterized protein n=1 Tax=Alexandrium monilatum TaxID=311494 RepID=A0A7S4Q9Q8_9DINO
MRVRGPTIATFLAEAEESLALLGSQLRRSHSDVRSGAPLGRIGENRRRQLLSLSPSRAPEGALARVCADDAPEPARHAPRTSGPESRQLNKTVDRLLEREEDVKEQLAVQAKTLLRVDRRLQALESRAPAHETNGGNPGPLPGASGAHARAGSTKDVKDFCEQQFLRLQTETRRHVEDLGKSLRKWLDDTESGLQVVWGQHLTRDKVEDAATCVSQSTNTEPWYEPTENVADRAKPSESQADRAEDAALQAGDLPGQPLEPSCMDGCTGPPPSEPLPAAAPAAAQATEVGPTEHLQEMLTMVAEQLLAAGPARIRHALEGQEPPEQGGAAPASAAPQQQEEVFAGQVDGPGAAVLCGEASPATSTEAIEETAVAVEEPLQAAAGTAGACDVSLPPTPEIEARDAGRADLKYKLRTSVVQVGVQDPNALKPPSPGRCSPAMPTARRRIMEPLFSFGAADSDPAVGGGGGLFRSFKPTAFDSCQWSPGSSSRAATVGEGTGPCNLPQSLPGPGVVVSDSPFKANGAAHFDIFTPGAGDHAEDHASGSAPFGKPSPRENEWCFAGARPVLGNGHGAVGELLVEEESDAGESSEPEANDDRQEGHTAETVAGAGPVGHAEPRGEQQQSSPAEPLAEPEAHCPVFSESVTHTSDLGSDSDKDLGSLPPSAAQEAQVGPGTLAADQADSPSESSLQPGSHGGLGLDLEDEPKLEPEADLAVRGVEGWAAAREQLAGAQPVAEGVGSGAAHAGAALRTHEQVLDYPTNSERMGQANQMLDAGDFAHGAEPALAFDATPFDAAEEQASRRADASDAPVGAEPAPAFEVSPFDVPGDILGQPSADLWDQFLDATSLGPPPRQEPGAGGGDFCGTDTPASDSGVNLRCGLESLGLLEPPGGAGHAAMAGAGRGRQPANALAEQQPEARAESSRAEGALGLEAELVPPSPSSGSSSEAGEEAGRSQQGGCAAAEGGETEPHDRGSAGSADAHLAAVDVLAHLAAWPGSAQDSEPGDAGVRSEREEPSEAGGAGGSRAGEAEGPRGAAEMEPFAGGGEDVVAVEAAQAAGLAPPPPAVAGCRHTSAIDADRLEVEDMSNEGFALEEALLAGAPASAPSGRGAPHAVQHPDRRVDSDAEDSEASSAEGLPPAPMRASEMSCRSGPAATTSPSSSSASSPRRTQEADGSGGLPASAAAGGQGGGGRPGVGGMAAAVEAFASAVSSDASSECSAEGESSANELPITVAGVPAGVRNSTSTSSDASSPRPKDAGGAGGGPPCTADALATAVASSLASPREAGGPAGHGRRRAEGAPGAG